MANGNAGNRAHRLLLAEGLRNRGHAVLLFDYRGYGDNPGRPSEAGVVADARAAVDFLRARDDVDAERIVYLGESLGSAVVAAVAVEQPPAALVLRSPFPSLVEVARQHYPFLPVRTLLRERHPTVEHLERYAGPTLVVAGERDRIIPPRLSREVADSAGASYLKIPETGHNDRALLDGDIFLDGVDAFVRDAVSG
ncbi:MAG: alpha/beta hydrolase [Nitriliruptoraceae bacterium]